MNDKSLKLFRKLFFWANNASKRNRTVQKLLYDDENKSCFSDVQLHEKMLSCSVRMSTYLKGIQRCIKPGDVVVDLGTGSGILSFFAAKQNPKKIYAIDHSDFIKVSAEIGKKNKVKNISYLKTNSRDFSPDEKVDVILHEQMGWNVFSENMIDNLLDLKRRVLKPSGVILPAKFELFIEPVVLHGEHRIPFIWEQEINQIDFSFLRNSELLNEFKTQFYTNMAIKGCFVDHFVCEPEVALSFDLNNLNNESEIPRNIHATKTVIQEGTVDGLCVYFRAIFDPEISFDTSPLSKQTCWPNMLLRTERTPCKVGDIISVSLNMQNLVRHTTWQSTMVKSPA